MNLYVGVLRYTEKGMTRIQDTLKRANAFRDLAKKCGVNIREQLWMMGKDDGLLVFEAKDDETATRLLLQLSAKGFVRARTVRAFDRAGMKSLLKK